MYVEGGPFESMLSNFGQFSAHVPFVLFHHAARNDIDGNEVGENGVMPGACYSG